MFTKSETLAASSIWEITKDIGSDFWGGEALITWEYIDSNKKALPKQENKFYIRGKNPAETTVKDYIGDTPWFAKAMAKHESGGNFYQFFESGNLGPSTPQEAIRNTKNLPNASFDKGFGIFQLTSGPPTTTQIWSWKANIDEAKTRISNFLSTARSVMNAERALAEKALKEGKIKSIPEIPSITYRNVTIKDQWVYTNYDKTFIHAVAMRRFNGIATPNKGGNHDFVEWDTDNLTWKFYDLNNYNVNYVEEVCIDY